MTASACPVRRLHRGETDVADLIQADWLQVRSRCSSLQLTAQFTVASKRDMPNTTFTANIGKALDTMLELFESDPALAPKAKL